MTPYDPKSIENLSQGIGQSLDYSIGSQVRHDPRLDPNSPYYDRLYAEEFFQKYGKDSISTLPNAGFSERAKFTGSSPSGYKPQYSSSQPSNPLFPGRTGTSGGSDSSSSDGTTQQSVGGGASGSIAGEGAHQAWDTWGPGSSGGAEGAGGMNLGEAAPWSWDTGGNVTAQGAQEAGTMDLGQTSAWSWDTGGSAAAEGGAETGGTTAAGSGEGITAAGAMEFVGPLATAFSFTIADRLAQNQGSGVRKFNDKYNPAAVWRNLYGANQNMWRGDRLSDGEKTALAGGGTMQRSTKGMSNAIPNIYGGLFESGRGVFGSSKGKDQIERDHLRDVLDTVGLTQKGAAAKLPGSDFVIDQESSTKLPNFDGTQRHPYDIDWSMPGIDQTVSAASPLAYIITASANMDGNNDRIANVTAWLTNSYQNNPEGLKQAYAKAGFNHNKAYQAVWDMYNAKIIDEQTRNAQLASVDALWGIKNPNQGLGGSLEFGNAFIPGQ